LASGEEEMEYCLGRSGGSRERKVPKGRGMAGPKRERRSRREVRLALISVA
jgi:hypothetical protein